MNEPLCKGHSTYSVHWTKVGGGPRKVDKGIFALCPLLTPAGGGNYGAFAVTPGELGVKNGPERSVKTSRPFTNLWLCFAPQERKISGLFLVENLCPLLSTFGQWTNGEVWCWKTNVGWVVLRVLCPLDKITRWFLTDFLKRIRTLLIFIQQLLYVN